ncbi:MAG: GNAT family N-acetyltransferase [Actinomycetes bacterium]
MADSPFVVESLVLDRPTLNEIGALGSRGFFDDPFFVHLADQPVLRQRGLAIFFRSHVKVLGDSAVVTGARNEDGTLVGVCIWQRPKTYPLSLWRQLREMLGSLRALFPRPPALISGLRYVLAMEKAHLHEEHWYLVLLVTDPMVWRRGLGSTLLEPGLAQADKDGLPAYLETQKEANLAYYQRFGFSLTDSLQPVTGGPSLFTMTRQSR